MAAPTKVWMVFPTVISSNQPIVLIPHLTENAAEQAAFKAAISTGAQHMIFAAISYVEPVVPQQTVDALILPIA